MAALHVVLSAEPIPGETLTTEPQIGAALLPARQQAIVEFVAQRLHDELPCSDFLVNHQDKHRGQARIALQAVLDSFGSLT
jgi:hypothetical protein